jgi:hypothetical protein
MDINQNQNQNHNENINANKRWEKNEEALLLKGIASGKSMTDISHELQRGGNAVQLRLKKIIYDNLNQNKSVNDISKVLNLPKEKVTQYYYSYKEHEEKQQKIKEIKSSNLQGGNQNTLNINPIIDPNVKEPIIKSTQNGGSKIDELKEQNIKMKLIIENHILKRKLSKILTHTDYKKYQELLKNLSK